ncbi:MAG TPA: hypothetical protein VFB23_11355 [Candidatus Acidoferrales bacterium]|nr:hypothetical protein [Candidatus Acidoferrales bacterium]
MRDPRTEAEWPEAVNIAAFLLSIHSAVLYGLLETDLKIDPDRCDEILEQGRERRPSIYPLGIDALIKKCSRMP